MAKASRQAAHRGHDVTALLFIKMLLVGMAGAAIVLTVDRITDKPYDPEREQRAQAWDDRADELLETALIKEAAGHVACDAHKAAGRARKHAKKIRRGKA